MQAEQRARLAKDEGGVTRRKRRSRRVRVPFWGPGPKGGQNACASGTATWGRGCQEGHSKEFLLGEGKFLLEV